MGDHSGIEWTGDTWNPITGCDRVSEGCDHCYALTLAKRLKAMGNRRYQFDGDPMTSGPGFGLTLHPDKLVEPLQKRCPQPIFVNSMSDLFHDEVPTEFIARVFGVMYRAHQHVFQVLTKRPGRMASLVGRVEFIEQAQVAMEALSEDPDDIYIQPGPWPPTNVRPQPAWSAPAGAPLGSGSTSHCMRLSTSWWLPPGGIGLMEDQKATSILSHPVDDSL